MKVITIAGTIGRDAEVRSAGERRVTGWSVAVDDGWGDKKTTLWFDCNLWGPRGEKLAGFLTKGGKVTVSGSLSTREHNGKTYLTVDVSDVTLQGGKGGQGEERRADSSGADSRSTRELDDEIPF
jgi:single-strand DNA-binding protein